jgi:hypothetical protein
LDDDPWIEAAVNISRNHENVAPGQGRDNGDTVWAATND